MDVDEPSTSSASATVSSSRRRIAFRQAAAASAVSPAAPVEVSPAAVVVTEGDNTSSTPTTSAEVPKRKCNPWSFDEVCAFYEGIKIHGKEFDSVVKVMARRKVEKTKDHVKTFFFNSAKTYKQMLALTDEDLLHISRDARELFLLVNACEWKRKTGNMKVNVDKLRELLFEGIATVRVGRKMITIKTPPCPALCRYFTCRKADKFPSEVFVHLEPTSNEDHALIRHGNHNPFLRIKMNINDRISKLLDFLQRKWSSDEEEHNPVWVTVWPDSACEVASLCVQTVETSPFIALSLNKLKKNVEEARERTEPKKTGSSLQMAAETNTKTKSSHVVYYPRPFVLTDETISQGIAYNNVKNAILAELFCVCGRKNPIQLRYQIQCEKPKEEVPEPWKIMIDLLNRGYGESLANSKREDEKDRRRELKETEAAEPQSKRKRAEEEPAAAPVARVLDDTVRQENEAFESQLALLRRTQRQKTVPTKRKKSSAPVLSTGTPPISIRPPVVSPTCQSPAKQMFAAPTCTVIPRKTRAPPVDRRMPTDFSSVVNSPVKRTLEMDLQRKRTDEFLSSLRTPNDTPVQTPKKALMQQLFGDDLSMSPNSTRHASHLEAPDGTNHSVIDFTDMMYQNIKDHGDTTLSNAALDFSVSEVQETYQDMMSSSQNSHDYILQQFQKKKTTTVTTAKNKTTPRKRR